MTNLIPGQGCRHPTGSIALVTRVGHRDGLVYYMWEDGSGKRYPGWAQVDPPDNAGELYELLEIDAP